MVFRKLYWVAEQIQPSGDSVLRGVFTSIPNLISHGFNEGIDLATCRLSLTRLDSPSGVLGVWDRNSFSRLATDLDQYVQMEDISEEQRLALVRLLENQNVIAA